ncbi:hypothetical protein BN10_1270002 [Phycicoccus elongatus Lp2]|uniref:ArsA/GET3 Anion-transporting ATPase-like domain-containing protein n=1 Tax=Phycicoccus elongatus Lp2 TaxID=1193181 RepID=N0E221_9MICO|nr:hypothetical protein BN10_1270002 [Phycicoccus elongatus Lp2]
MAGRGRDPELPAFDIDALVGDASIGIIVCCGAGGVGKTTRRVVVLTIDPARRLAQSLGLTELDNTPRPVVGVDESTGGSLDAMMLDMKRTFDDVVEAHAAPDKAAQILANPFYQAVSSSFAGTQEYMAMEKLGQLRAEADRTGIWDLIVVDTPPSRSALDFLDAPKRLGSFLDGRFIRLLSAPAKALPQGLHGRGVARDQHDRQDPGRADARRRADLCRGPRHHVRGFPGAGRCHLCLAQGGLDSLRRRRGSRAGRLARGGILRRPAGPGGYAARGPRRQPRAAIGGRHPRRRQGDRCGRAARGGLARGAPDDRDAAVARGTRRDRGTPGSSRATFRDRASGHADPRGPGGGDRHP